MARKITITFFAPAERETIEVVRQQAARFERTGLARILHKPALNYVFVLNSCRQIVTASENVLELLPAGIGLNQIVGLRLGEALGCIHAWECGSGCGAGPQCAQCAAVRATLQALKGQRELNQCRMTRVLNGRAEVLDLRVLASPICRDKTRYTLLTLAITKTANGEQS